MKARLATLWAPLVFGCHADAIRYSDEGVDPVDCVDESSADSHCFPGARRLIRWSRGSGDRVVVAAGFGDLTEVTFEDGALEFGAPIASGQTNYNDSDNLLTCDVDGDGASELIFSPIDALTNGLVVWGEEGRRLEDLITQRLPIERLDRARCLDVDGDDAADLIGVVSEDLVGVHLGAAGGFEEVSTIPLDLEGTPAYFTLLDAADLDDDGSIELVSATAHGNRVSLSRVDFADASAGVLDRVDLADVEVEHLVIAAMGDAGTPALVVAGATLQGAGLLAVVPIDLGDDVFATPVSMGTADAPRHVAPFDLQGDGDDELLVVGSYVDEVYVLDMQDDALVRTHAYPGVVFDAVPAKLSPDDTWDLVSIHGGRPDQLAFALDFLAPS